MHANFKDKTYSTKTWGTICFKRMSKEFCSKLYNGQPI